MQFPIEENRKDVFVSKLLFNLGTVLKKKQVLKLMYKQCMKRNVVIKSEIESVASHLM